MLSEALLDVDVAQWEIAFDDRFACKMEHEANDHSIRVKRPATDAGEWDVIARFGDGIEHTVHDDADGAIDRLSVLLYLYDYQPDYEVGTDVFVVSGGFEPVAQQGMVEQLRNDGSVQSVRFLTDPFDAESGEPRSVGVHGSEVIRVDPSPVEIHQFLGSTELLTTADIELEMSDRD